MFASAMEAVLLPAGTSAPHMESAAPGSDGEWPNPQATGDEEGIKMPHYSHNYSLTNPIHKGFSHVMTLRITTLCLLSVPEHCNAGSGTSNHCQREWVYPARKNPSVLENNTLLWKFYTKESDYGSMISDNASWLHCCHFKKQYCRGTLHCR